MILLEAGDEGALVFFKDELGDELTNALHVQKLNDVNLIVELLRRVFVALEPLHSFLEPCRFAEATTAPVLQEGY